MGLFLSIDYQVLPVPRKAIAKLKSHAYFYFLPPSEGGPNLSLLQT